MSEEQDGIIKMIGWNHICFTVSMDVLVLWVGDDDGMTNGILLYLVKQAFTNISKMRLMERDTSGVLACNVVFLE